MNIATIVITGIVSCLVTLITTNLFHFALKVGRKDIAKEKARDNGLVALMRVQLIEYHDKYMTKGSIPSYALENFELLYDAYHELGGNGMITHMYEEIHNIPIKVA